MHEVILPWIGRDSAEILPQVTGVTASQERGRSGVKG